MGSLPSSLWCGFTWCSLPGDSICPQVQFCVLGKHHDPKSVGHQMKVVPLALARAVSGELDPASMERGFWWWWLWSVILLSEQWTVWCQELSGCAAAKVSKSFTGGHVRVWRLPLFVFADCKIILPVFPQIHRKSATKRIHCFPLISSLTDFPFWMPWCAWS